MEIDFMPRFGPLACSIVALGLLLPVVAPATTVKAIYSITASGDGEGPAAALVEVNGKLYGTTRGGGIFRSGTAFALNPTTGAKTVLHSFGSIPGDGTAPAARLINVGGMLYGTTAGGGAVGAGTVFKIDPATGTETVLYAFTGGSDSREPLAGLIEMGGTLYGTAYGNTFFNDYGAVFAINPTTGAITVLHSFGNTDGWQPTAALINVGGTLYGTTSSGGGNNRSGTVFKIDPATGTETLVYSFPNGAPVYEPISELIEVNGKLYGTTVGAGGSIFSIDPTTGSEQNFHYFSSGEPNYPQAGLVEAGGALYDMAHTGGDGKCGAIFKTNPTTGHTTVVHSFTCSTDGANPVAALINWKGKLYGTTPWGGQFAYGPEGGGTAFAFDPAAATINVLHSFIGDKPNTAEALLGLNGSLYLTAATSGTVNNGAIVKVDPATGNATTVYSFTGGSDGSAPYGAITSLNGKLFGTTSAGGASGNGTVFTVNPATGTETVLHSFAGGNDGASPQASPLNVAGMLYGTTMGGGASGNGTVFKIDPAAGTETVLHAFAGGRDGAIPMASLIDVNGTLYGTTYAGGVTCGCGTVFAIKLTTGNETILHSFANYPTDGLGPAASLIAVNGVLYGTTTDGGIPNNGKQKQGYGTVFAVNTTTGDETILRSFGVDNKLGFTPRTALTSVGNALYGTNSQGPHIGFGTIFKINRTTGAMIAAYDFKVDPEPNAGGVPLAALVNLKGTLYGATSRGGAAGLGTIFSVAH
jgi:uncharacterized repeat protein (TIGR03803 family)